MIKLVNYQEIAIAKLVDRMRKFLLSDKPNTKLVFKSPTGSGKTLMMAEALRRISSQDLPVDCVFIWASLYGLHSQSKSKLDAYLYDTRYQLITLDDLTSSALEPDTVLFTNWESLTKTKLEEWDNLAMREGETERDLIHILNMTRALGRSIVLIVDESHHTYLGVNSQRLVSEVLQPKLIVEISATPKLNVTLDDRDAGIGDQVSVQFSEVVESELIKSETRVNPKIENFLIGNTSNNHAVIAASLAKRDELELLYSDEGSEIRPLVLIQLPSDSEKLSALDVSTRQNIENYLAENDITYDNGKLAIWLSGEKRNLQNIQDFDCPVDVLIFKRAVAVGWDCPRAQILVMLQEMRSVTFQIQTVGRILRMPEQRHYKNAELNAAYVFTNLATVTIDREDTDSSAFYKIPEAYLREGLANVALPNVYIHRTDYNDLTAEFSRIFIRRLNQRIGILDSDSAEEAALKADKVLEFDETELAQPIIIDEVLSNLDALDQGLLSNTHTVSGSADIRAVEYQFGLMLVSWVRPYSRYRSKEMLYRAFFKWFGRIGYTDDNLDEMFKIVVCSDVNQRFFTEVINASKEEFERVSRSTKAIKRRSDDLLFSLPSRDQYPIDYVRHDMIKSALVPFFAHTNQSDPERFFITMLENSANVSWWYKNGERRSDYFAIAYTHSDPQTNDKEVASFYPDFIVKFMDGSIGVYDTKSGFTVTSPDTFEKSDALQAYILEQRKAGLNLTGGILNLKNSGLYIFDGQKYSLEADQWKTFSL